MKNRIRDLRKKNGISQIELANSLHVTQTSVSQWETGKTYPDHKTLINLAKYFEVTTDHLLGNTDDPTPPGKKKAPPTLNEMEAAYIKMLCEEKGVSIQDLVITEEEHNQLRGTILAMIKGYGK